MPFSWNNFLTSDAIFIYSCKLWHVICAVAIILFPDNFQTCNSCTDNIPFIFFIIILFIVLLNQIYF